MAGCQAGFPGAGNTGGDATRAAPFGETVQLIERDVEAPEVFSTEDRALWDGRPSLGGVWVAAPNVRDPERVIIRNTDNGKFVIGALFKRERVDVGPSLQLSSDAAAALGILAGSPTTIDVVALRREEVAEPAAAPATTAPQAVAEAETAAPLAEEIVQTAEAPAESDPIAAASAALDRVETGATGTLPEAPAQVAAAEEPARRGNFFSRLFNRGQREAAPTQLADDNTQMAEADAIDTGLTGAAAPTVTATSLDAAPAATAAPVRTASAAPAPVRSGGLERAYVQIGIFSVEQNARNTATALSNAGVLPTVLKEESRGRTFWRVIVGPSTTSADRAAVIRKARDLGFTDAFAVRS